MRCQTIRGEREYDGATGLQKTGDDRNPLKNHGRRIQIMSTLTWSKYTAMAITKPMMNCSHREGLVQGSLSLIDFQMQKDRANFAIVANLKCDA